MQFPHNPISTATPRRTHSRLSAVGFLLVAGLAATGCASAEPGVGRPAASVSRPAVHILNTTKIERAIARSSLEQRGKSVQVTCPSEVRQERGVVFYCAARYQHSRTPFAVTEMNSSGDVHYVAR